ncbi:MAG: hypothetical protein N2Z62_16405 [Rhodobacteraceae bacterium]|nr:hypothetical protein [Paracoccaceae bacterium]
MNAGAARLARSLLRLALLGAIAWAAAAMLEWVRAVPEAVPGPAGRLLHGGTIALALVVYALLLALPFVPGVEIGLLLLALQGPAAALPVYLATLAGLLLAYAAGRRLPPVWLAGALADLGLARAAAFVGRIAPLSGEARLALLRARLPRRLAPLLGGARYGLLAALLNLPGNGLVGGGGGIMLLAGLSGLFRPGATVATVALAVAPVPLAVWFLGARLM